MALQIGDNFSYLGKKFLDSRESFDTLQEMYNCNDIPEGFITYCKEDGNRYEFKNDEWIEYVTTSEIVFENKEILDSITQDRIDKWDSGGNVETITIEQIDKIINDVFN